MATTYAHGKKAGAIVRALRHGRSISRGNLHVQYHGDGKHVVLSYAEPIAVIGDFEATLSLYRHSVTTSTHQSLVGNILRERFPGITVTTTESRIDFNGGEK